MYSIAAMWAAIPVFVLGHVFSNVVFPLLSRARNEGQDVAAWFHDTRRPVVIAAAWLATCLIAGGPTGMLFLYGTSARRMPVGSCRSWRVGAWLHALENGNSNAVLAMGKPKWLAASNGAKVAGMFALIPCGFIGRSASAALPARSGALRCRRAQVRRLDDRGRALRRRARGARI